MVLVPPVHRPQDRLGHICRPRHKQVVPPGSWIVLHRHSHTAQHQHNPETKTRTNQSATQGASEVPKSHLRTVCKSCNWCADCVCAMRRCEGRDEEDQASVQPRAASCRLHTGWSGHLSVPRSLISFPWRSPRERPSLRGCSRSWGAGLGTTWILTGPAGRYRKVPVCTFFNFYLFSLSTWVFSGR